MKLKIFSILLVVIVITQLYACNREEIASRNEILTSSDWVINRAVIDPPFDVNGSPTVNYLQLFDSCTIDNRIKFYADESYEITEGAVKCTPNVNIVESGYWNLINSGKTIEFTGSQGDLTQENIKSISENNLITEKFDDFGTTVLYKITLTRGR